MDEISIVESVSSCKNNKEENTSLTSHFDWPERLNSQCWPHSRHGQFQAHSAVQTFPVSAQLFKKRLF